MYLQNLYLDKPEALMRVKLFLIALHYDAVMNYDNRSFALKIILAKTRNTIITHN